MQAKRQFSKGNQVALFETETARNAEQHKSNNFPKIIDNDGQSAVSARELHYFLGSRRDFSNWIQYRIKQIGLVKNQDYSTLNKFVERAKMIEYVLTLESAKQIAMMEGTERGRMVRMYFIRCEERLREVIDNGSIPVKQSDNILNTISKLLERMDKRIAILERKQINEEPKPKHSMNFAIRNVRLHLNLNTFDFARILDYTNSHICHIESLDAEVSDRMIDRLVDRLHVNRDYILSGKLPMRNIQSYNPVDLLIETQINIRELKKNLHIRNKRK